MNDPQEPRKLKKPTIFDNLYPGRFLKASELMGKKVTLTISDIDLEELQDDTGAMKAKAIISFKESEKKLVACKTNGFCIKEMFGKELANWIGKRITIFEDVWNGGPCIRLWGSPEIAEDLEVTITLPRRRPFKKMLHRIELGKRQAAAETE